MAIHENYTINNEKFGDTITDLRELTFGSLLLDSANNLLLFTDNGLVVFSRFNDKKYYLKTVEVPFDEEDVYIYVGSANELFAKLETALITKYNAVRK